MGRIKQKLLEKRKQKLEQQKQSTQQNPPKVEIKTLPIEKENSANQQKKKDQKGKDDDDSRNALEKIIKLDKKNSNFDLYDPFTSNILKVRSVNYQINYQQIQGLSQTDHQMRQFWRHVNSTYLRRVQNQDENKLEYLKNLLNTPLDCENAELEWDDWRAYLAVQYILDDSVKRAYQDDDLSHINYENFLLHTRITFLIANQYIKDKQLIQKILSTKKKITPKNTTGYQNQLEALQEEQKQLQQIIKLISENSQLYKEIQEEKDELLDETVRLKEELKVINQVNHTSVNRLEEQLKMEFCKQQLIYLETDYQLPKSNNEKHIIERNENSEIKHQLLEKNYAKLESMNLQAQFLYETILKLEKRQLAETISCITAYSNKEFPKFELRFEPAYNDSCEWVSEELLDELNSLRDQSLFQFYNIPQKTLQSHTAHNFLGWNHIQRNRDKPNLLKQKNIKDLIKAKEIVGNRMATYDICHHCKHLFKKSILLQCKYKSSTMGLPVHNYIVTDPFLFSQIESENSASKKPQVNKKRNCFTMFQKVEGDLVCKRMYCRSCLKQNYDLILSDIKDKHDWLCPFCQGNCYCTRCLRNELVMKYKGIYMLLGGDINLLQRESVFEYFSQQMSQQRRREFQEYQMNNSGRGLKNSVKGMKLKDEYVQKIFEIERLRQLCQLVNKREKYKFEQLKQNIDIFREKYSVQTDKEFPVIDINTINSSQYSQNLLPPEGLVGIIPLKKQKLDNHHHPLKNSQLLQQQVATKNSNNKIKMIQINKLFKKKHKKSKTEEEEQDQFATDQSESNSSPSSSSPSSSQSLQQSENNQGNGKQKKNQALKLNKLIKKTKKSKKIQLKKAQRKGKN